MATKKPAFKLLLGSPPTFCPECKTGNMVVSADGNRVVVRHGDNKLNSEFSGCVLRGKLWSYPQPTVDVTEV